MKSFEFEAYAFAKLWPKKVKIKKKDNLIFAFTACKSVDSRCDGKFKS